MRKVLYVTSYLSDARVLTYKTLGVWTVLTARNQAETIDCIESERPDFIFFDLGLTGCFAPDLLKRISVIPSLPPLFILSREYAFSFLSLAREAGACGYFHIPYDGTAIITRINAFFDALPKEGLEGLSGERKSELDKILLGTSRAMHALRNNIQRVSSTCDNVLIRGETGSGKDLVARLIHDNSPVSKGPFVSLNVSCIPATLAESQLFGTVKGSYTDSIDTAGIFEQADGGTLFLDEIGELDLSIQPKFLRVLENGVVTRLGSCSAKRVTFRLICATNKDIESAITKREFREDLFYRLDVLRFSVPPLRERREDIPLLASAGLSRYGKRLSNNALIKLGRHDWPGNVRQLFQCLSRAASMSRGNIIYPEAIQF